MVKKTKTLSLIIPVYNEENYIRACLDSIAEQSIMPLEVIIVDNNSTDDTINIAREFPFVRIITEKRQHQSYAQHKGFGAAHGDILGRIDADTLLPKDWVERYLNDFEKNPGIIGFSGGGSAYDTVCEKSGEAVFKLYIGVASKLAGQQVMWGSNCAFRKTAWKDIKDDLLLRADIWEDYDLGFCLGKHGRIAAIDNRVAVSYRAIHRSPLQMFKYQTRSVRTFYHRKGLARAAVFSVAWSSLAVVIPFALIDCYVLRSIRNLPVVKLLGGSLRGYLLT